MDNQEWAKILRSAVIKKTGGPSAVTLPKEHLIAFSGTREQPVISMTLDAITKNNMQENAAAFEAWAVALLTWGKAEQVHIRWDQPDVDSAKVSRHFARFMYRVERLKTLLGGRVELDEPEEVVRYRDNLLNCRPVLNVARGPELSHLPSPKNPEAEAEKCFKRKDNLRRRQLMDDCDLVRLCRQFPVGLFKGDVKRGNEIFTGGKSAIDLIGVDRADDIWLFELKVGDNNAVGALSELLFYAMVVLDAAQGNFKFGGEAGERAEVLPADVKREARIHACILADQIHPLLDDRAIQMINDAFKRVDWPVDLRCISHEKYRKLAVPEMA